MEGAPPDSMVGDECDRQGQQIWRIEGEGGTAHPSNTRGSALQPRCWPGAAWLLGFHTQGFVREATPTTTGLISKGFSPFSMNELHGFWGFFHPEPVRTSHLSKPYKPPHHVSFLGEFVSPTLKKV